MANLTTEDKWDIIEPLLGAVNGMTPWASIRDDEALDLGYIQDMVDLQGHLKTNGRFLVIDQEKQQEMGGDLTAVIKLLDDWSQSLKDLKEGMDEIYQQPTHWSEAL